ncbi:hypothetical protein RsTz2092_03890 [Deferribacterales bacterium RsTz2092]|nr:hypothetical protein AGMMS49941_02740 [Deferribacterales bacterium]
MSLLTLLIVLLCLATVAVLIVVAIRYRKALETLESYNKTFSYKAFQITLRSGMLRELEKVCSFIAAFNAVLTARKRKTLDVNLSLRFVTNAGKAGISFAYLQYLLDDIKALGNPLAGEVVSLLDLYNNNFKMFAKLLHTYKSVEAVFVHIGIEKPDMLDKVSADLDKMQNKIDTIILMLNNI